MRIHSLTLTRWRAPCRAVTVASIHSLGLAHTNKAWLFIDSVFPVKLAAWDFRYYYGQLRQEHVLEKLSDLISQVHTHGFKPISIEPHMKDGGVFVLCEYIPSQSEDAISSIQSDLRSHFQAHGGVPSSAGLRRGNIWIVQGQPWREDMNRFASPLLRVIFDGADPQEESLYHTFRPYGRIVDISAPTSVFGTSYRASTVTFSDLRSSIVARNVVHGLCIDKTRLRTSFIPPVQGHVIRDWVTKHPRIVIPVIVFFLGTLTYAIFDPIRTLMVKGKILDWFDYRETRLYQWLRTITVDGFAIKSADTRDAHAESAWQERQDAETALRSYLDDAPTNVAFIHGPQGSGKSKMLSRILRDKNRPALTIDCAELQRASSDVRLVDALSRQTGYWPVFTVFSSMNNFIDLATVGFIGQKAGLSSSLPDQVKQVLEVVGTALRSVSSTLRKQVLHNHEYTMRKEEEQRIASQIQECIRRGVWHDPRMGPIMGGGVIAELGVGDEPFTKYDENSVPHPWETDISTLPTQKREGRGTPDLHAVNTMPIVILKNYTAGGREEVMDVLATWAAALVEGQTAHVIIVSHNRENSKPLAKALPSKPLTMIGLHDADNESVLQFVKARLHNADVDVQFSHEEMEKINYLGGRASDLTRLVHKMRAGQRPIDAVEDIIRQDISELRKRAFGEDADDTRSLLWSREQAWAVFRALASRDTVSYHETLMNAPFKGDEAPLRSMERAELITVDKQDGRPPIIRPGRPVYRFVFRGLANDPIFRATQDISFNAKLIESAEGTVRACEQELQVLCAIGFDYKSAHWWRTTTATENRAKYLMERMADAQATLQKLEKENKELKKGLAV
ncbi:RNA12 protein-domain-containing protein [Russula earlei]|uniref:RNA12 protein-domain-containing protein n=1 Tax=Russula earlei TaxID=71964 RepID=A0ACC0UFX5_9AGAM|nr:RNA12 protein-domain-containing protein [Russula earlei]